MDKAVASVGALNGGSNASDVRRRFSSNDKSYRKARKVEKTIAYHVEDLPRNSSNPEDLAMMLARGLSPALDELAEVASKTADDVVDFILNGRLPEEDDWPAKNRARMEEELRDEEDAREREIREQEAAMERRAMEDLWSDGPAMEEAIERGGSARRTRRRRRRTRKGGGFELARGRPRVTELSLDALLLLDN